jgi:hypothetical protein
MSGSVLACVVGVDLETLLDVLHFATAVIWAIARRKDLSISEASQAPAQDESTEPAQGVV